MRGTRCAVRTPEPARQLRGCVFGSPAILREHHWVRGPNQDSTNARWGFATKHRRKRMPTEGLPLQQRRQLCSRRGPGASVWEWMPLDRPPARLSRTRSSPGFQGEPLTAAPSFSSIVPLVLGDVGDVNCPVVPGPGPVGAARQCAWRNDGHVAVRPADDR